MIDAQGSGFTCNHETSGIIIVQDNKLSIIESSFRIF